MKQIRVINTFYNSGLPVVEGGKLYPADHADALRQVARGNAEVVEVPDALVEPAPAAQPAAASAPTAPRGRKG